MKLRRAGALALVGGVLALAACSPRPRPGGPIEIVGAGSTFVYPLMSRWAAAFHARHPNVTVNYQSIGSGGGIEQVRNGTVEFGASDAPLTDAQLRTMPPLVQFPESAGPVCVTYNLPGLRAPLRLTGALLAAIYLGRITDWRDPRLEAANRGAELPAGPILVVHRSDGSGTTAIFTAYLAAVSRAWARQVGSGLAVGWPAGLGGKGSEGVTGTIRQTPGAIGYVELSFARENRLPVAAIENPAGRWLLPSEAGATAALAAAAPALARDVRAPVVAQAGAAAYPITGLTFLIVPRADPEPARRAALVAFLAWAIGPGQTIAAALDYAPLPPRLVALDRRRLAALPSSGAHN